MIPNAHLLSARWYSRNSPPPSSYLPRPEPPRRLSSPSSTTTPRRKDPGRRPHLMTSPHLLLPSPHLQVRQIITSTASLTTTDAFQLSPAPYTIALTQTRRISASCLSMQTRTSAHLNSPPSPPHTPPESTLDDTAATTPMNEDRGLRISD